LKAKRLISASRNVHGLRRRQNNFDQVIYGINDEGNLAALSSGDRDFESRFTYTGTGSLYTAQYTTDAAGNATIEFSTEGAADGDTIVWNNDYGGTAGSNAGKAYNKDGTDFAPITFTYNGTSGKWEYTGPTTPATVTADIKAHIYSSTGEYKYVELQNVELNMETGAGEAIFTIDKSKLWGGEDLVIYNNGTSALGGIDPTNPQIAVGDKAVISISGQSAAADSQQVNIDYTYRNIDKEEIGSGSHSYVFQAGTLDDKTTDFKFFTLNQQTGLSYEGTISQTTRDFAADDKAASFTYQAGIFDYVADLVRKVQQGKLPEVGNELAGADTRLNELLLDRSTIGARINRLELQQTRLNGTQISLTSLLSDNEDANEAEVIMNLKIQENVYNASWP
jgi:flagellar hook-associated protein 3 FlgL